MTENVTPFPILPRAVRAAPDPLGLYIRAGRNDHKELLNLIATGDAGCFGIVFDPTLKKRHGELLDQVLRYNLDAILDPRTQQSATRGACTPALEGLPWGVGRPHAPEDFSGIRGRRMIAALGNFIIEHGFTQVLAPTHLLNSAADEWLATDVDATRRLRIYLDRAGGGHVPIIYSLAVTYGTFQQREQRRSLIDVLKGVPASELWLKIEGFGATSAATRVQNYLEAAVDFHELGILIVADHGGGLVGLSLLGFGAVAGIAHGVTLGERFDARPWHQPRGGDAFAPQRRVYFPTLDLMLKPRQAKILLGTSNQARGMFGCKDTACCRRGTRDMVENPARHFLYQRMREVTGISQIPEHLRPQRFLEQYVRPTTDRVLKAATINWEDDAMAKKTREQRKRLDALRVALGKHAEAEPPKSFAVLPKTQARREASG